MSNQITPMQDLLEDLKETKVTAIEALNDINNVSTREICKEVVTKTLNVIIERIETELLPKEQQVIFDAYSVGNEDGQDNIFNSTYYNAKFKQNEK